MPLLTPENYNAIATFILNENNHARIPNTGDIENAGGCGAFVVRTIETALQVRVSNPYIFDAKSTLSAIPAGHTVVCFAELATLPRGSILAIYRDGGIRRGIIHYMLYCGEINGFQTIVGRNNTGRLNRTDNGFSDRSPLFRKILDTDFVGGSNRYKHDADIDAAAETPFDFNICHITNIEVEPAPAPAQQGCCNIL